MRETLKPMYQTGEHAYVLGARIGSNNIGEAIARRMNRSGWSVTADDAAVGDGVRPPGGNIPNEEVALAHGYEPNDKGLYQTYAAPSVQDFTQANADALVITLGKTYKGHFADIADHEVSRLIRANLILPLEAARRYVQAVEAGPDVMVEQGEIPEEQPRRIVFIGSYAHDHPFTNGTLYCAAKAGLDMATRCLGWELTGRGYRVHIVHPYHVQGTPMWAEVEQGVMESKQMTAEQADDYNRKDLKMPDLLKPHEVAEVVAQLLDPTTSLGWTSGTSIELYGGSR